MMADGCTKSNEKMRHSATPSLLSSTSAVYTTWASRPARFAAAMNALHGGGEQVSSDMFRIQKQSNTSCFLLLDLT